MPESPRVPGRYESLRQRAREGEGERERKMERETVRERERDGESWRKRERNILETHNTSLAEVEFSFNVEPSDEMPSRRRPRRPILICRVSVLEM